MGSQGKAYPAPAGCCWRRKQPWRSWGVKPDTSPGKFAGVCVCVCTCPRPPPRASARSVSDLLPGHCLPGSLGSSAACQGCFSLLLKEQRRDPAGGGEGWHPPRAGCVWSWSRGGVRGAGEGGWLCSNWTGQCSISWPSGLRVPQFPQCKANDLASQLTPLSWCRTRLRLI